MPGCQWRHHRRFSQLALAADMTLDELRAELIYPLDEQADSFFRGHDGEGTCS